MSWSLADRLNDITGYVQARTPSRTTMCGQTKNTGRFKSVKLFLDICLHIVDRDLQSTGFFAGSSPKQVTSGFKAIIDSGASIVSSQ